MAVRLPEGITACLFDLDGVLTRTAVLHAEAWKQAFDELLSRRAAHAAEPFVPFDDPKDYDAYVDGRARLDGTREFLESRGIELPEGDPADPPESDTVQGVANRKNALVLELMESKGVDVYPGSVRFVEETRRCGLATAVVSASANTVHVLRAAGIDELFDACVDGVVAHDEHLEGKPAPDTYLAAARRLGVPPGEAAVFEDALAGVESGRAGGFSFVVGVDRAGQRDALRGHGADVVVDDLAELLGPA
ncbi:MAG: HAD family hydrolase [Acidimicrobiales bacterium]